MPHQTASHPGMPYNKELCRQYIQTLLDLKLIRPFKSHWVSPTFYINKHSEQVYGKKKNDDQLHKTE